jgi:hypothetical protein
MLPTSLNAKISAAALLGTLPPTGSRLVGVHTAIDETSTWNPTRYGVRFLGRKESSRPIFCSSEVKASMGLFPHVQPLRGLDSAVSS